MADDRSRDAKRAKKDAVKREKMRVKAAKRAALEAEKEAAKAAKAAKTGLAGSTVHPAPPAPETHPPHLVDGRYSGHDGYTPARMALFFRSFLSRALLHAPLTLAP